MERAVEAIILAGGKGTRLAPLTEDTPKPMLKVMGKSVLECVFDKLCECGIHKAHVTTMYLPWQIESLGTHYGNLEVNYVREQRPLGTAGAVKNAYDGTSDTVIVLSGDGIYDFDLNHALDYHKEKNADVTIVTYQTENPLEYGVVLYGSDGRVQRFAEKPPWAQVVSGMVNTGIYILNRSVLERIPSGTEYDFAKQLFPLLLAGKHPIYAYEAHGTWHDIGNLDEYFAANCSALDGKIRGMKNTELTSAELAAKHIEVEPPVYVSPGAVLGENVKLGAYTVIGDGAVVSDGCDIACSVLGEGVTLGMGCGVYGTLIGRGAKLGENCVTSEGCAVGGGAEIEDSVILPKFSFIHSGAHVAGSDFLSHRTGKRESTLFGDEGIRCGQRRMNPEYLMRIGLCAAQAVKVHKTPGSSRVGVMSDGNPQAERLKQAALCGVQAAGVRSYDFGNGFEAMARFAAMRFITDAVLYVCLDSASELSVKIFDGTGLPVNAGFEREFSNLFYSSGEYTVPDRFYTTDRFDNLWTLYYSELVKNCRALLPPEGLKGFCCRVPHEDEIPTYSAAYTVICAIHELGGTVRSPGAVQSEVRLSRNGEDRQNLPEFRVDASGAQAECTFGNVKLDSYHLTAMIIGNMTLPAQGTRLFLSSDLPDAYRAVAKERNIECCEYAASTRKGTVMTGDDMYRQLWLSDGVCKLLYFAVLLHQKGTTPQALVRTLPAFEIYSRRFEGNPHRAGVMQKLAKMSVQSGAAATQDSEHEGVRLILDNGSVTVIPGKAAGFRIISEAKSMEAAKELCDRAEEFLK